MPHSRTLTVEQVIAELQRLPGNLTVFIGTAYDNDTAETPATEVRVQHLEHIEAEFYEVTSDTSQPVGVVIA